MKNVNIKMILKMFYSRFNIDNLFDCNKLTILEFVDLRNEF